MRVKVILNPWADRGRALKQKDKIEILARPYGGLDFVLTESPGQAEVLTKQAVEAGYDLVVAAGGDGTVHEVVNGLFQDNKQGALLGVIPIGTGNDFAYELEITDMATAVSCLFEGKPRTVDLAHISDDNGRSKLFDTNLGIGFDAIAVILAERITFIYGFLRYLLVVMQMILFHHHSFRLEAYFDNEMIRREALFLAMGIGRRRGGGFVLTPDALIDDSLIDSCLADAVGRFTMLTMLHKAIKGTHTTSQYVTMRQNRQIVVYSDKPLPIHLDGEVFAYPSDNVRQVTVTSLPAALTVIA